MSASALALVLVAALMHALWNVVAKKSGGDARFALITVLLMVTLSAVVFPATRAPCRRVVATRRCQRLVWFRAIEIFRRATHPDLDGFAEQAGGALVSRNLQLEEKPADDRDRQKTRYPDRR